MSPDTLVSINTPLVLLQHSSASAPTRFTSPAHGLVCTLPEPTNYAYASHGLMPPLTSSCWTSWTVCALAPPTGPPRPQHCLAV
jgi:hypothetical protein